jgi:hypothetical protein
MANRTKAEVSDALLARLGLLGHNKIRSAIDSGQAGDITLAADDPVSTGAVHSLPVRILPSFSRTTLQ